MSENYYNVLGVDENSSKDEIKKGSFSFTDFYVRRIRRIFPSVIVVLVSSFIIGWFILFSTEFKQLGKHVVAGAGFVSNIVLWSEAGYFDNSSQTKPLIHLWSLGIEEQFYIIWPFFLWFLYKYKYNFCFL
jgi:peptidoglycan/LPS O-acetylase OafA/YrhL